MGKRQTTEAIWSQLSDDLRRFIRRRVANEHVTDDLLQDTFLRIHRGIVSLRDTDRLAGWVYQIARNVIHDHFRSQHPADVALVEDDLVETDDGRSQSQVGVGAWLHELVQHLPEPYREAVQLSELEGVTQRELARRLGLSLSGAKSRVQRGRRMLKEILEDCCRLGFDAHGSLIDCDPKSVPAVCQSCP